jgi:hypothetical protein
MKKRLNFLRKSERRRKSNIFFTRKKRGMKRRKDNRFILNRFNKKSEFFIESEFFRSNLNLKTKIFRSVRNKRGRISKYPPPSFLKKKILKYFINRVNFFSSVPMSRTHSIKKYVFNRRKFFLKKLKKKNLVKNLEFGIGKDFLYSTLFPKSFLERKNFDLNKNSK